jgi:hypothetical protein
MRLRRRHTAWLTILGALVAFVLLSGTATPPVAIALVGLFLAALLLSTVELRPRRILARAPQSPLTLMRMSSQAREAVERARRRSPYGPAGISLLDVGLITSHSSSEGMTMRRSRSVSLDDDGVRPYVTLHVQPEAADRNVLLRFEITDHHGETQFVHEMKTYLRDGEMNVLVDHHLPLARNERLTGAGEWDLRVQIDGALAGVLSFTVTPSLQERNRILGGEEESARERLIEVEDDAPMSLEDLLRSQNRSNRR